MSEDDKNTLCRRIVETVGDAVIFADRDGIIRLWNRAAEGIFGYPEEEAIGQSLDLIILGQKVIIDYKRSTVPTGTTQLTFPPPVVNDLI